MSEQGFCIVGSSLMAVGLLLIVGMLELDFDALKKGRDGLSGKAMRVVMGAGAMVAVGGVLVIVCLGGAL